jgi:uncharacterized protein (TIGR02271 family)
MSRTKPLSATGACLVLLAAACQSTDESRPTSQHSRPSIAQGKQQEVTVPVTKEEIQVGKREVQEGTTRLKKRTIEKPVEEQVQLRDENVRVERRAVDRPVKDQGKAFEEKTIEMTETKEEPVVSKRARVTEEVTLKKEADQRTGTVRDTVRETDVEVQRSRQASIGDLGTYERDFRRDFESTYATSGMSYEEVHPAYEFGYKLAKDPRYDTADWTTVEPQAQRDWEMGNPGTWSRYKAAIKYAWQRTRQGKG